MAPKQSGGRKKQQAAEEMAQSQEAEASSKAGVAAMDTSPTLSLHSSQMTMLSRAW